MEKLVLIGAGGYAKSVLDSIDFYNYEMIGFVDGFSTEKEHLGYPILAKSLDELPNSDKYVYFIAIGDNQKRKIWFDRLIEKNYHIINVVDKSAIISPEAEIGIGCFVGKMSIINSKALVGNDCVINTKSVIEHGCHVGNHVNLSTNAVINGDVIVDDGSFIGSCSVTIGQLRIGSWSTVGAGAVVIRSVGDNVTVAGVPAKIIKEG
ncbi:MAG: acetyltransferase [Dorea sp.]|nr:acetyltransferase [Dorea sp.]